MPLVYTYFWAARTSGLPLILPEISMQVGDVLHFRPYELKHNLHPDEMLVAYLKGVMCPVTRLRQLLWNPTSKVSPSYNTSAALWQQTRKHSWSPACPSQRLK